MPLLSKFSDFALPITILSYGNEARFCTPAGTLFTRKSYFSCTRNTRRPDPNLNMLCQSVEKSSRRRASVGCGFSMTGCKAHHGLTGLRLSEVFHWLGRRCKTFRHALLCGWIVLCTTPTHAPVLLPPKRRAHLSDPRHRSLRTILDSESRTRRRYGRIYLLPFQQHEFVRNAGAVRDLDCRTVHK